MNRKKLITGVTAAVLVGALAIGGTLAYLSSTTDKKTNTFTMGTGITGSVTEDAWENGGKDKAEHFVPGMEIGKNPIVHNNSVAGTDAAYVAFKINYTNGSNGAMTAADIQKFASIDWSDKWAFNADYTIAYYIGPDKKETGAALAPQSSTEALFTKVTIDPLALTKEQIASANTQNPQFDLSKYDGKIIANYEMKNFEIQVQGYLVQSSGMNSVQEAMYKAYPDVFPAPAA